MTVALIVPWSPSGPDRFWVWAWVEERLRTLHSEWTQIVATEPVDDWSKARAINRAICSFAADNIGTNPTLIVVDADVALSPDALRSAVKAVEEQGAPWAVPHRKVYRLNPEATLGVLAGPVDADIRPVRPQDCQRPPYDGLPGGGVLVVSRAAWELVGGFDERFVGWGSEDGALGYALDTLAGQHSRGTAPLWHLYHPMQDKTDELDASQALEARYLRAQGNPEAMRALVDERSQAG